MPVQITNWQTFSTLIKNRYRLLTVLGGASLHPDLLDSLSPFIIYVQFSREKGIYRRLSRSLYEGSLRPFSNRVAVPKPRIFNELNETKQTFAKPPKLRSSGNIWQETETFKKYLFNCGTNHFQNVTK